MSDRMRFCSCMEKVPAIAAVQHAAKHKRLSDSHKFVAFSTWKSWWDKTLKTDQP